MANEVEVFEMIAPRGDRPVRPVPFLEKQVLSIAGAASADFGPSTAMVTINTNTACRLEFGNAPDGSGDTFPIEADTLYDFDVVPGTKVIAVAA